MSTSSKLSTEMKKLRRELEGINRIVGVNGSYDFNAVGYKMLVYIHALEKENETQLKLIRILSDELSSLSSHD